MYGRNEQPAHHTKGEKSIMCEACDLAEIEDMDRANELAKAKSLVVEDPREGLPSDAPY